MDVSRADAADSDVSAGDVAAGDDAVALRLGVAAGANRFVDDDVGDEGRRKREFRPAKAKAAVPTAVNKRRIG